MSRARATLAQVAAAAKVSVSTASDALRGRGRVSDSTRARVVAAAKQLGYRAQGSARALRSGVRPLIVFHLDTATTHTPDGVPLMFWSRLQTGFVLTAQEYGYGVIVDLGGDPEHLGELPAQALAYGTTDPANVALPDDLGFGSVLTFSVDPDVEVPSDAEGVVGLRVGHDYEAMGRAVGRFLGDHDRDRCLALTRPGSHPYVDGIVAGLREVLPATTTLPTPLGDPAAASTIAAALTEDPDIDSVLDLAMGGVALMAALERLGRTDDLGSRSRAGGIVLVEQSEVPLAHLRDPRVAYLSFDGLNAGEELAENVIAALGGRPPDVVDLPFLLVPPLRWEFDES